MSQNKKEKIGHVLGPTFGELESIFQKQAVMGTGITAAMMGSLGRGRRIAGSLAPKPGSAAAAAAKAAPKAAPAAAKAGLPGSVSQAMGRSVPKPVFG